MVTSPIATDRKSRTAFIATLAAFAVVVAFTAGCADKTTGASAPGTGSSTTTGTAAATAPTPEQEAAKQKAEQQGPAVQAAIQAAQQGK